MTRQGQLTRPLLLWIANNQQARTMGAPLLLCRGALAVIQREMPERGD
jgi:hypothetical protein